MVIVNGEDSPTVITSCTLTLFDGYTDATPPIESAGMLIQPG
ncbi:MULTISPECIES: hypothetical protein [unclassified Nocardia]